MGAGCIRAQAPWGWCLEPVAAEVQEAGSPARQGQCQPLSGPSLSTGAARHPYFTDEDIEAQSAGLMLSHPLPCARSPSRCCGGNRDESDPLVWAHVWAWKPVPGRGRCRLGRGKESGASWGTGPSGGSTGRWAGASRQREQPGPKPGAVGAGAVLCQGWGEGLAETQTGRWQTKGAWGASPPPPAGHMPSGPLPTLKPHFLLLDTPLGAAAQRSLPFAGGDC